VEACSKLFTGKSIMQVKLRQVIWLLLKQWRSWNEPVDFVGLVTGLRKLGVKKATAEEIEAIALQEFADSIINPTPEQVARNIALIAPPSRGPVIDAQKRAVDVNLSAQVIAAQIERLPRDVADANFWNAASRGSIHNDKNHTALDKTLLREAIARKRLLTQNIDNLDFLQYPEDIVPGESPIAMSPHVSSTEKPEKHILDND